MMEQNVHHIPVVEDGVPVGVVAGHDVLELLARPN
jgi:signal-transduction protein with cAMP-binding, CBS, and nucleotidyltransferase domain